MTDAGGIIGYWLDGEPWCLYCGNRAPYIERAPIRLSDCTAKPLFCEACGVYLPTRLAHPADTVQDLLDAGVPRYIVYLVAQQQPGIGVFLVQCDDARTRTVDPGRELVRFGLFDLKSDAAAAIQEAGDAVRDGVEITGADGRVAYVQRLY